MTMRVALHLDGKSDGAKKAINETRTALKTLDHTGKAVTKTSLGIGSGLKTIGGATQAIKLNNQQLMNMQFQVNDMAVMMASGQNPFVMIMQQGMQIGQIFGPGASVSAALKATGTGILTFLTNPINLFIAGTAVAAGGIGMLWDAASGPEAKAAKDMMEDFSDFVGGLEKKYDSAAIAAKRYLEEARAPEVVTAQAKQQLDDLTKAYEDKMSELSDMIFLKTANMFPDLNSQKRQANSGNSRVRLTGGISLLKGC